jgi:hypothetical protein
MQEALGAEGVTSRGVVLTADLRGARVEQFSD